LGVGDAGGITEAIVKHGEAGLLVALGTLLEKRQVEVADRATVSLVRLFALARFLWQLEVSIPALFG
jgi:hypothetical protein